MENKTTTFKKFQELLKDYERRDNAGYISEGDLIESLEWIKEEIKPNFNDIYPSGFSKHLTKYYLANPADSLLDDFIDLIKEGHSELANALKYSLWESKHNKYTKDLLAIQACIKGKNGMTRDELYELSYKHLITIAKREKAPSYIWKAVKTESKDFYELAGAYNDVDIWYGTFFDYPFDKEIWTTLTSKDYKKLGYIPEGRLY